MSLARYIQGYGALDFKDLAAHVVAERARQTNTKKVRTEVSRIVKETEDRLRKAEEQNPRSQLFDWFRRPQSLQGSHGIESTPIYNELMRGKWSKMPQKWVDAKFAKIVKGLEEPER